MPNRRVLGIDGLVGILVWLGAAIVLAGCAEQELYEPPASPFRVAGRVPLQSEPQDVAILGNYAYVAAGQGGLQVVDITDPSDPELVFGLDTPKFAEAIAVARTFDDDGSVRDIAFVVEGTEGILPFDITSVPDTLIDLRQGTSAYAGNSVCVRPPEYVGDPYVLFLADSWRAITGFVSAPDNPGFLDQRVRAVPHGYSQDLALSEDGTHLYVADDEMGVTILDATGVFDRRLEVIGNTDTPDNAVGIAIEGDYIFVADDDAGLQILEIGPDYLPELITALPLPGDCIDIAVCDGVAFITAEDAGLHVIDVRDPYHPSELGNVPLTWAVAVAVGEGNIVCVADEEEGIVLFRGPTLPADFTPPATIEDLSTYLIDTSSFEIHWTAPGDDADVGTADLYELRWSESPIADSTWDASTEIIRRPLPQEAGTAQSAGLSNLTPGSTYYIAIKTVDDDGNWSALSNVTSAVMTIPTLSQGAVLPDSGGVTTLFTYSATYTDPEGDPPVVATVVIDGEDYMMETTEESPSYTEGVEFEHATTLGFGVHEFLFVFDDGHGPLIETTLIEGPELPEDPFAFVMQLIAVGGGTTFTMGSPEGEVGRDEDELAHEVTLTRDFYLCTTEVSQNLYEAVMETNPSDFGGSSRPVEEVTWFDALLFCNALSEHDTRTPAYTLSGEHYDAEGHLVAALVSWDAEADGYRLPTEAEWEYACRAGATSSLASGELTVEHCELDPVLAELGWYCGNADIGTGPRTRGVAQKAANSFGLYDMHGNVWEWCWDEYGAYPAGAVTDPNGPIQENPGQPHVRRGGSWYYFARDCRSASRGPFWPASRDNTLGLRIARNAE
ncbi:MAG: SUMF1/EgtB/PvdO family nonheme iron enzyme [Candidatus Eisenbacteria sp.]|nr:SUMF1/EgtB/PvdO family nonheme iron enzyme [Candidatus Eisenbacteria bacterium]